MNFIKKLKNFGKKINKNMKIENQQKIIGLSSSPVPRKEISQKEMNFPEAIKQIILGMKITRIEWKDKEDYGILKDGFLMLHKSNDNKFYKWIINEGDINGTDWIIND